MGNQKEASNRSYIKIGNKKLLKYKADDRYCRLCMEENLAIASSNNSSELLNQTSEILKAFRH